MFFKGTSINIDSEAEKEKVILRSLNPGETFLIGTHEFIILKQGYDFTKVISKNLMARDVQFDENTETAAIEKVLVSEVLQKCKSTLSERDYYIFCLFLQGITYREIAKRVGVSRAMAGKVITKTLNMIKHL